MGAIVLRMLKKAFGCSERELAAVPGRNELCWCGSGLKYKRCHLESDNRKARAQARTSCATG